MTATLEQTQKIVDIDHLSYSTAKKIYRRGIDYALGTKLGLIEETYGRVAEIGSMIHELVLEDKADWILSPYDDFRSKAAKEWRAEQTQKIVKPDEQETILETVAAIRKHPLAAQLISSCDLEQKLKATINEISFHGCADGISKDRKTIFDLKTTAQFDQFKWQAFKNDYDLQASIYSLFGDNAKYFFIVAETVAPYRVQIFGTSPEFIDNGNEKLQKTIDAFKDFRTRAGKNDLERITFNIGETDVLEKVELLGDWSE